MGDFEKNGRESPIMNKTTEELKNKKTEKSFNNMNEYHNYFSFYRASFENCFFSRQTEVWAGKREWIKIFFL